jgi:hypothetical protein
MSLQQILNQINARKVRTTAAVIDINQQCTVAFKYRITSRALLQKCFLIVQRLLALDQAWLPSDGNDTPTILRTLRFTQDHGIKIPQHLTSFRENATTPQDKTHTTG